MIKPQPIAIVGIGGIFPQAPILDRFWENIAGRFCASREVPKGRWLLSKADAFDPRLGAPDKVYSLKACPVRDHPASPRRFFIHSVISNCVYNADMVSYRNETTENC